PPMSEELIRSRSNPLVKRLRALKAGGAGELLLLEGPKLVEEAMAAGVPLVEVAASPRLLRHARGRGLAEALRRLCPVRVLDGDLLDSLSEVEASQGLLALARRPAFAEGRLFAGTPLVLVAVGVQDPGNVGALLRTGEAAGASGAYLAGGTADPFSWKALRGSMGSAFRLPHVKLRAAADVVARLRARGVRLVGTSLDGARAHDQADLRGPVAVFFGAEGSGLAPEVAGALDEHVRIPMAAPVESLNVAVAAGVVLFEARRQRTATLDHGSSA
ncbi:MAG TPA: RNA methyltransferase, partial [Vicinamibacteria bacterium]|nr:RNA methyltransferase [Vicinamibacteria bacterium]